MVPTLILVLSIAFVSAFVGMALVNAGSNSGRKKGVQSEKNAKEVKRE